MQRKLKKKKKERPKYNSNSKGRNFYIRETKSECEPTQASRYRITEGW